MFIRLQGLFSAARKARPAGNAAVLTAAALACFLVQGMQVPVYGYTAVEGTVTARSGFVRKEASVSSSCVFCVSKDDTVVITDEKTAADGRKWYRIQLGGSEGYIRSDLVKKTGNRVNTASKSTASADQVVSNIPAAGTGESKAVTGMVKGSRVIIREKESTSSQVISRLDNGDCVAVTGVKQGSDDGCMWYAVSVIKNGSFYTGYIRSDLLAVNGTPPTLSTTEAAVQSAASSALLPGLNTAGTVQTLSLPGASALPSQLPAVNGVGQAALPNTQNTAASVSTVQLGTVKGMGVNIRKKPVSGEVVAKLNTGHQITVTKFKVAKDGNIWCKISYIYNMTPGVGFIRSDFVSGITIVNPQGQ